jgi:uncharacterized protein YndB with AHSA1/START domain
VIVVHRLLKNQVVETYGMNGYLLLTDACATAAGLDPRLLGMAEHREAAEGVGEVVVWVHDLEAAWSREQTLRRVRISEGQTAARIDLELPVAPASAWQYATAPEQRMRWQLGLVSFDQDLVAGRRGVGSVNHCVHGDGATLEEILDWRPFDYVTVRSTIPRAGAFVSSQEFTPTETGTHITIRFRRPGTAAERAVMDQMGPMLLGLYRQSLARLEEIVRADLDAA